MNNKNRLSKEMLYLKVGMLKNGKNDILMLPIYQNHCGERNESKYSLGAYT